VTRLRLFSAAGAALAAGCLVFLNLLSSQFHLRWDLSAERLYSLSPGSERILRELEDPVDVRVYFSKQLPPEYSASRSYVKDLLQEYRDTSEGHLRFEFVDVESQDGQREALEAGITPVEFNVVSREKFELRQGLMGLVLRYEDKKETLPILLKVESLEYDLTSRILRLTRRSRKAVGVLSSHGALSPESLHPRVRELLERNYDVRPLDLRGLTRGATIPAELSALLVLGPTEELQEGSLYAVDQFLMSGRPMALCLDTRRVDLRSFMVSSLKTGLEPWLRSLGFTLRADFVLDAQCQKVQVSQQRGWFAITNILDFPPFVLSTDLDKAHPVTRHLNSLTLPFVSAIEGSAAPRQGQATSLVRSSRFSWLKTAWGRGLVHSINPMQGFTMDKEDLKGPFDLMVEVQGPFTSYFKTSALPRSAPGARFILAGTSRFAHPDMPDSESGAVLLLSLVDWMLLDSDLIAIRAKGSVFRPLREVGNPAAKAAIRWLDILGPAFLIAVFGAARFRTRRSLSRRRAEESRPREPRDA